MVRKSMFALQQDALTKPVPPVKGKPATPVKVNPTPTARPRGRPKTRLSTLDEISAYLYVSRSTVYRLIETQQMPHLRIGGALRFDLPTILKWAAASTESDEQPELKHAH